MAWGAGHPSPSRAGLGGGRAISQEELRYGEVGILVLEDEASTMELVVHYLRAAGAMARLETADSLGAALRSLAERRIDLVIADLHLPDSRGLDTVEALRRAGDQLIIVFTGDDDPGLRAGALERGAYDFLHKSQLSEAALGRIVRLAALQARTHRSLRASEARLRAIIEAEPECVKLLDAQANLLEMNPAGLRMIEAESLEPVRGHCVYGLVAPAHRAAFQRLVESVIAGGHGELEFEIAGLKGARRWVETRAVPFSDPATGQRLVLGITRDVTERKRLGQRGERLARMYAALSASNEAMLRARGRQALLDAVCRASVDNGGFLAAAVMLAEDAGAMRLAAASGPLEDYLSSIPVSLDRARPEGRGLVGEAFREGRPAVANDYFSDARTRFWHDQSRASGLAAAAAFPLVSDERPIGVLVFYSAETGAFDAEMVGLLGRIAENAGFALELLEREALRAREEAMLGLEHAITRLLAEAESVQGALQGVMRAVCEAGGWDLGRYFRLDAQANVLRFSEYWCADPSLERFGDEWRSLAYAPGHGLVGIAWASGEPLWSADVSRDPRVVQMSLARAAGVRGALVFPVAFEHRTIGVLSIASREVREPDERLLRTMRVIGSQLGQFLTRKDAESALRESEGRFRETFELAASGIAHVSPDGRFLRVNSSLCRMLGTPAKALVGRTAAELSHPEDRDVGAGEIARLRAGDIDSARLEKRFMHKDGSVVWVNLTVALARDAQGAPQYEIAVIEDISARKETERAGVLAEQRLRESEARFRRLAELSSDWYWEQDAALRFVATGGRSEARGGISARVHVGKCRWELPGTEPVSQTWDEHRAVLDARQPFRDFLIRRAGDDGEVHYVSVSGAPIFDAQGAFRGYQGVARDVTLQRRGEEELRRFRAAMDMSADAIYLVECAGMRFLDVNEAACRTAGRERAEMLALGPHEVLGVPRAELERTYGEVVASGDAGTRSEITHVGRKGRTRWFELHRRALQTGQGWIIVSIARDITDRKVAEVRQASHLRHQERIARFGQAALAKRGADELIAEAAQTVLEGLGAAAVAYVEPGPGAGELVLRALVGVTHAGERSAPRCAADAAVMQALATGGRVLAADSGLPFDWARGHAGAALVPVRGERAVRGALCVFLAREGTHAFAAEELNFIDAAASLLSTGLQRIDSEGRLAYLAQFDALTGLPNRALLADRFAQMIAQARRHGTPLGVLFIDLDEFKLVNDSLGHAGGDALLAEVASRLQACVRPGDTVARISGDEFAVVLADMARTEDAALVAQKIIDRLAAGADIMGHEVFFTASIGIAAFPADGGDAESLLRAADAAMYRAKQGGRNTYQFFTSEINQRSRARAQLGSELRRALDRGDFALAYQPKFELATRRPRGAEALLRWQHPERGMVPPAEFIPVLEETGLIVQVGEWVLRRACQDLRALEEAGIDVAPVAVNLSARQFRQHDLDARIKAIVEGAGVAPAAIELEITESQLMQDPDHAIRVMRSLCEAGMQIAIDDFGTGYSSLSYLTRFPVGSLKIDRSFVRDLIDDRNDAAIVRAIIDMAHTLGFRVVAEGIETEAQAAYLREHGCDQGQGFFFARPMPAPALVKVMSIPAPARPRAVRRRR